ncbi:hypothetical protein [Rummeliibacillus suwonensis]|uniref:hypothetical protein n=1 Tax=Rummeliibacillus suwonensis TaxID=1306154 RepID=UPI0028982E29|nr:hypothetical protein [Rummeliibacillus suwonensis]
MAKPSKKKQDEMIVAEINRLNAIFRDVSEDSVDVAKELIERIAFMTITLEILEDTIKTKGPTYIFKQGSQVMLVENPAQRSYNAMINRYTSAYEKLFNLLPKELKNKPSAKEKDAFQAFNSKWADK